MEKTNQQSTSTASSQSGRAFQDFVREAEQVYRSQSAKDAFRLLGRVEEIQSLAPEQASELVSHQLRLQAIAITLLPIDQLGRLFAQPLGQLLEFRVTDRLRTRLMSLPLPIRQKTQAELRQTLLDNAHELAARGSGSPKVWLKAFGEAKQNADEFMRTNVQVQKLSIEDQIKVERLVALFELVSGAGDSPSLEEVVIRDARGAYQVQRGGQRVEGERGNAVAAPAAPVSTPRSSAPQPAGPAPMPPAAASGPPARKIAAGQSAEFYFHPEDEADVHQHRTRLAQLQPGKRDFGSIVANLLEEFHLSFSGPSIQERFVGIIESRLRDVRDLIETKTMLCRPIEVGGVGLPEDLVMQILAQVEEEAIKVHHALPQFRLPPVEPAPPLPVPVPEPTQKPIPPEQIKKIPVALPVAAPRRVPVEAQPAARKSVATPVPTLKRPTLGGRPVVSDIKRPVKVLSPVEELQSLTLDDFRKLGKNLKEMSDKVVEKLDLLEEDSYLKRAEGVQAWKKSETYQLYLAIGRESMERNLSIADVITRRESERRPSMSPQEFEAIADLNKRISF